MLELGYKDFEFDGWIGVLAPDRFTAMIARETERSEAIARRAGIEKQ